MSRYRRQYRKIPVACSSPLLGVVMVLLLSACEPQQDLPGPPQSPPKPVTKMSLTEISTAHLDLSRRPEPPPRGWM